LDGTELARSSRANLRRLIAIWVKDVAPVLGQRCGDNLNLTMLERDDNDRLHAALDFAGWGVCAATTTKGLDLEIKDAGAACLSDSDNPIVGRACGQDPASACWMKPTAALDQRLDSDTGFAIARLDGQAHRDHLRRTVPDPCTLTERTLVLQDGRMTVDGQKKKCSPIWRVQKGHVA